MKWVIQSSGINDLNVEKLIDVCLKNGIQYLDVGLIPFTDKIINIEKLDESEDVIFYGSTKLVRLISRMDFKKGIFFNNKFNALDWMKNRDDLLNEFSVMSLKDFLDLEETLFVRPVEDLKTFAGQIVGDDKWKWYEEKSHGGYSFDLKLEVAVSSIKEIEKEWRIFIIKGEVVTGSQYRVDRRLNIKPISPEIINVARKMAQNWLPHENVAMDLCLSEGKYKIIEFNCFNCAGFYSSDVEKIIKAF